MIEKIFIWIVKKFYKIEVCAEYEPYILKIQMA